MLRTISRRVDIASAAYLQLVAFLLFALFASTSALAADPVASYGFGEGSGTTVADATGNGHTGVNSGATWTPDGRYGNALAFDGVGDRVNVADDDALDLTGDITVSAWIYPTVLSGYKDIVVKGASTTNNYYLETNGSEVVFGFYAGGWREHITSGAALTLNIWHHVAAVFDNAGDNVRIYVDGIERLNETETATPQANAAGLTIGYGFGGEDFAGRIDDVRLYGRALSQAEVQADLGTPVDGGGPPGDTEPPTVTVTEPSAGATITGQSTVSATASDNVGVVGVQFLLDGAALGSEDTAAPYTLNWDSSQSADGAHSLSARARDAAGNKATSSPIEISTVNGVSSMDNDWLMVGGDQRRSGYAENSAINPSNVANLSLRWSVQMDGTVTAQLLHVGGVSIAGQLRDLIIATTSKNSVYALDAGTGEQIWWRSLPAASGACGIAEAAGIRAAPVVERERGRVFVVPSDGRLYTMSLFDGTDVALPLPIIDLPMTNKVRGGLNLLDSNLYIASGSAGCDASPWRGRIYRVDVSGESPSLAGTFDVIPGITGDNRGGGVWGFGGVSVDPDTGHVYAASGSDKDVGREPYGRRILSLTADLTLLGSYEPPPFTAPIPCDGDPCDLDFGSTPLVFQPEGCPVLVTAGNKNGDLYLLRATDLEASLPPIQTLNLNIVHDWLGTGGVGGIPAYWPEGRMVFVSDAGPGVGGIAGGVVGFQMLAAPACTLQLAWSRQLPIVNIAKSSPTVAGGLVFVGEGQLGVVHAYDAATGVELWNSDGLVPYSVFGAPTVAGDTLFVGSWGGGGAEWGFVQAFSLNGPP